MCCYGRVFSFLGVRKLENDENEEKIEFDEKNVTVEVKEKEDGSVWVNVDIAEDLMNIDCSNMMKKVLFCKAVRSFYKRLSII